MKRETLEDVICMAVRVQRRMRKDGVELRWTLTYVPIEPETAKDANQRKQPGDR